MRRELTDPTFHRKPLPAMEAQALILSHLIKMKCESVPLDQAVGRYLAEDLLAPHDLPHFARSGMDGYAVRSADLAGARTGMPIEFEVIEDIPCGAVPQKKIGSGQTARIMTGAMLPECADTVVMLEMVEVVGDRIRIIRELPLGRNVTEPGFEVRTEEKLLNQGTRIGPGEIALLATFGFAIVPVFTRPVVAVISTGDELLEVDAHLVPGKIRNSNRAMLQAQIELAGATALMMEPVGDILSSLVSAIDDAFLKADVVITTGGVSVGDRDVLVDWFGQWDGKMLFNKLKMRPGSPTTVGVKNHQMLFALSGNPGACFVGFELFVSPALRAMMGAVDRRFEDMEAVLTESFDKPNAFERYVRGCVSWNAGRLEARLAGVEQSSIVRTIAQANALLVIPAGVGLQAGQSIRFIPLRDWKGWA